MNEDSEQRERALQAAVDVVANLAARPRYEKAGWTTWNLAECPLTGHQFIEYLPSARVAVTPSDTLVYLSPDWIGDKMSALVEHLLRRGCKLTTYRGWKRVNESCGEYKLPKLPEIPRVPYKPSI
jgi:hypothetical protein